jgi:hypothetical protein
MRYIKYTLMLVFLQLILGSCDSWWSDTGDTLVTEEKNIGVLDMAFVCRISGIPASRVRKVELSLARTADELYQGIYFIQTNVSDAVVHYRFDLPPGEYFYYAKVLCLSRGDSCQVAGFSKDCTMAAGGKVTVVKGLINSFTTNFH